VSFHVRLQSSAQIERMQGSVELIIILIQPGGDFGTRRRRRQMPQGIEDHGVQIDICVAQKRTMTDTPPHTRRWWQVAGEARGRQARRRRHLAPQKTEKNTTKKSMNANQEMNAASRCRARPCNLSAAVTLQPPLSHCNRVLYFMRRFHFAKMQFLFATQPPPPRPIGYDTAAEGLIWTLAFIIKTG
jgi:hypothetical protein